MNYERLKSFIAVCEQRSFSKAAQILYVTQPTITSHIKMLEQELKTKLFERTTKKNQPTKSAYILLKYAKKIVWLTDSAKKEFMQMDENPSGELRVGASFTIGEYILPEFLKEFNDRYPMVQMNVEIKNSNQIVSAVMSRTIDAGVIETPSDEEVQVNMYPILKDELMVIAPEDYEKDSVITIDELKEMPLILREKGSGTRKVVADYLKKAGILEDELQVVMELGSTESIKSAVEAGLGISILSKSTIKKELKLNLLKTLQVKGISFMRSFYMVYRKDYVQKTVADLFLEELKVFAEKKEVGNLVHLPTTKINEFKI